MSTHERITVHGEAGTPVALPLPLPVVAGYQWRVTLPPGVRLVPEPDADAATGTGTLGDDIGSDHQLVVADATGEYGIVAELARPWEPDRPVRTIRCTLRVE